MRERFRISAYRKTEKSYKFNRFLLVLQMLAGLALAGVILLGIQRLI